MVSSKLTKIMLECSEQEFHALPSRSSSVWTGGNESRLVKRLNAAHLSSFTLWKETDLLLRLQSHFPLLVLRISTELFTDAAALTINYINLIH